MISDDDEYLLLFLVYMDIHFGLFDVLLILGETILAEVMAWPRVDSKPSSKLMMMSYNWATINLHIEAKTK